MSRFVVYPLAAGIIALALSGCGQNCEGDAKEKLDGAGECKDPKGVDGCKCHLERLDVVLADEDNCKEDDKWSSIKDKEVADSKKQCCEAPVVEAQKKLEDARKDQCKADVEGFQCCEELEKISKALEDVQKEYKEGCGDESAAKKDIIAEACKTMKTRFGDPRKCRDANPIGDSCNKCRDIVKLSECPADANEAVGAKVVV